MGAEVVNDNIKHWKVWIIGPPNTPYEDGKFYLDIKFSNDYPFKAPCVKFITMIFHPNVKDGKICLDILGSKWTPVYNPQKMMISIISLLNDPNCDDPYNVEASNLYQKDKPAYDEMVKDYVKKYAE